MSYHSTIFTNKEIKRHFPAWMLSKLVLISIKGKPAKTKNLVKWNGNVATIFGQDFVAKVALKDTNEPA